MRTVYRHTDSCNIYFSATPQLFKACIYATVAVPVMFYAYLLMYRILKKKADDAKYEAPKETDEDDKEEAE